MKRHIGRQQETWSIVLLVLVIVVLYTTWGASVLHAEKQADSGTTNTVVATR